MNPPVHLNDDQITEACRMVRENYKGLWPLDKVASLYGINPSHLKQLLTLNQTKEAIMPKKDAPKKTETKAAPKTEAKATTDKPKAAPKEKRPSYQDKIRAAMAANKGVISRDDLIEATGADSKNLSVAVSILGNPARQKEPMLVQYVRKLKTYFCMDMPEGAKAHADAIQGLADADAKAKADKKAAAKAKKAKDKENEKKLAEEKAKK